MKESLLIVSLFLFSAFQPTFAAAGILSLKDVLHQVDQTSPELKASKLQRIQADDAVLITRATLLPQLDLSVVDSWGMTGASYPVPPQFGGIMASPFRVGAAGGLLGKFTLLDVVSIRAIQESHQNVHVATERTRLDRANVLQTTLQLYFQTATFRSDWHVWQDLIDSFGPVLKHVEKFVRNGQYSPVQRLLIIHQIENAKAQRDVAFERYRTELERLKVYVGLRENQDECPPVSSIEENVLETLVPGPSSPWLTHAEAQVHAANARVLKATAEHLPKIYALGSAGFLEGTQFVGIRNYSAWVGVTVPVFEGFRITSGIHQAQAQADQQQELLATTRLQLADLNIRFQQTISTSEIQLRYLIREKEAAAKAFNLAKQRYFSFLEPLANLLQAMHDLNQVNLEINQVKAQWLLAKGAKVLVNGGQLK